MYCNCAPIYTTRASLFKLQPIFNNSHCNSINQLVIYKCIIRLVMLYAVTQLCASAGPVVREGPKT